MTKAKQKLTKIIPFITIMTTVISIAVYFMVLQNFAKANAEDSFQQSLLCVRLTSDDINDRRPPQKYYLETLQNAVKTCDAVKNMYAELFDKNGDKASFARNVEKDLQVSGTPIFSAMADPRFHEFAMTHNTGEMTVKYNKDFNIHLAFEWIPNPSNTDLAHNRFLLVVGKIPTFQKDYQPTLMLFALAILSVGVLLSTIQMAALRSKL